MTVGCYGRSAANLRSRALAQIGRQRARYTTAYVFLSFRENIDTGGPLGRAVVVIIGAIAELERNLIIERVRAGMRRARLEGRRLGRPPLHHQLPMALRQ